MPELIVRKSEPLNLEMPFSTLDGFLTPTDRFYVRCHFPIPEIEAEAWQLRIEGDVKHPLEISLAELRAMPARTITAVLECAGNGRAYLSPRHDGVQWELGAVGNAEWRGVALADILRRAGLPANAAEVILEGADRGHPEKPLRPADPVYYARSIPVAKALRDVLLVYDMNGSPLPVAHGFPLRAIVPGWYGAASIKWLQRIVVSREPFHGYFQTIEYAVWQSRPPGQKSLVRIADVALKAAIARPASGEVLPVGRDVPVYGAAWSGSEPVAGVEVSTDGGEHWQPAHLLGEAGTHAWRLWSLRWRTPNKPGPVTLIARAYDAAGRAQPKDRNDDLGSYAVHHWVPVNVELRA